MWQILIIFPCNLYHIKNNNIYSTSFTFEIFNNNFVKITVNVLVLPFLILDPVLHHSILLSVKAQLLFVSLSLVIAW